MRDFWLILAILIALCILLVITCVMVGCAAKGMTRDTPQRVGVETGHMQSGQDAIIGTQSGEDTIIGTKIEETPTAKILAISQFVGVFFGGAIIFFILYLFSHYIRKTLRPKKD